MTHRVLLIEDEPSIADTITYALDTEGMHCVWCPTGKEGLEQLEQDETALIILDVGLPDGNGFDLCRQIRKKWNVPIIFLTARTDEIDRVVGLEIGGDDYVVKPFSPRELSARVKAILRRTQPIESQGQDVPRFQVDEGRCQIRYYGQVIEFSRYEYLIMKVLIQRPGWVYSREKLMNMVWDEPYASMDRTVDSHIKSIRAKLRAVRPDEDAVKTHRGLGYSLKETR